MDMATVCRFLFLSFALAYVAALFLFLVGTVGWFGQEPGPLAGVFLVPLGLPWNRFLDGAPDDVRPFLVAAAPFVNPAARIS